MEKQNIKIFIASAAELKEEREKCILLINQLNKSHKHLDLEPVEWEYDMVKSNYPEHDTIQDAINPKLKECDLVVFLFYSKIGSNTFREFEYATKEKKKIFTFFKSGFTPDLDLIEPYKKLLKFKQSLNNTILKLSYNDITGFEKELYPNLNLYLGETYPVNGNFSGSNPLSRPNLDLIKLLGEKEDEIRQLDETLKRLPHKENKRQLLKLRQEKEAITYELSLSQEIIKQQAKDKEDLENELSTQRNHDILKAKALEEIEKGKYAQAESHITDAVKLRTKEFASDFYELAKINKLQFKYVEALNFFELAVKVEPENNLYLTEAGDTANILGYYEKALDYYENSLIATKKNCGEGHINIGLAYKNIGCVYYQKGEYDKAIGLYEKALAIYLEKVSGEEHADIVDAYTQLGSAYECKEEYMASLNYYKKSLKIAQNIYGKNHNDIAKCYNNLGYIYDSMGEYDKAISYYKKTLLIQKKNGEHPDDAICLNNLGFSFYNKGNYPLAIGFYEKALLIYKKYYGEEHPYNATCYNNIGLCYSGQENFDKAIDYYEQALVIDKKFYGENHPKIGIRYNNLGSGYFWKGKSKKALVYYETAFKLFQKFLPCNHSNIINLQQKISVIKEQLKKDSLGKK